MEMEQEQQLQHYAPPQWPNISVPPGYRFKPTAVELIECYLAPWVATPPGHQSPGEFYGIMAAADVYGEHPSALTSRFPRHDDGNWYFLTVSQWKDGNRTSKRMKRGVGGGGDIGTWHGSTKRTYLRGRAGGYYRQGFEFRLPGTGRKSEWLMEEFGDDGNAAAKSKDGVMVLCRIYLRPKAAADERKQQEQQQQLEAANAPDALAGNKRQRQSAPALQQVVEPPPDDLAVDYSWTAAVAAAADVACSSSYATAAAAPLDVVVGCSSYGYATATTSSCQANAPPAAPVTDELMTEEEALAAAAYWQQQHQPMTMEQEAGDGGYQYQYQYQCQYHHCAAGGHGGLYIAGGDEPQPLPLAVLTADGGGVEFTAEDFNPKPSEYVFSADDFVQLNVNDYAAGEWFVDSNGHACGLPFIEPVGDAGVQENNDLKPEPASDGGGVQEQAENNDLKPEPSDGGVLDDPKPKGGDTDTS